MMFRIFLSLIAIFSIWACKPSPTDGSDPQEKLTALKTQLKEIQAEIKQLETEIAASKPEGSPAVKSKLVTLDTLRKQEFKHFIELQGTVDASQNVLAAPQMPGVITGIFVKEGDFVSAGKLLASMDGNTIRKGIEEVKTGLQLAVTMYEKQKKLWDQNIGSEAQFLQAKSQKESLEQRLQTMEAQFSMTYIKAPVSGIVDEIKVKLGEMASPGFSGIRVVNGKELKVKANLSDVHIGKVKKGDKVELIFPDLHKSIHSNVSYVGQSVNANNRTIMVEAKLPNANNEFKANQFSKMKINDGILKNAIVVPSNLVQHSISGEYYVLVGVPENGLITARKKLVKMGVEYNGETQILEGLQAGDLIITAGYNEIVDGQHIQI